MLQKWRIDQVDMHYRDERALNILKSKVNPDTNRPKLTLRELAELLGCHPNTASRIMGRLEGAGYIKRYGNKRSPLIDIELICLPSTPAKQPSR